MRTALPWIPAALAVLLVAPSVGAGLFLDDYILWAIVSKAPATRDLFPPQLNLWAFIDGNGDRTWSMMDRGFLPWWIFPGTKFVFWRPLASLTHWLDFSAWPNHPVLMHLHSLVWFAGMVLAATLAYRRFMPYAWAAGLAAFLYAIDGNHAHGPAWIASRNILLAGTFGFLCLWAHDRWRRSRWSHGSWVSPGLLAVGLLSSESTVGVVPYLIAHALFLDRAAGGRRLLALLPYGLVLGGWQAIYQWRGHGLVAMTPLYLHPLQEPSLYFARLVEHAPMLLLAQWTQVFPSRSYAALGPSAALIRFLLALTILGAIALVLTPLWRRDAAARFFALGQLLAVLPISTAPLADRYAIFVGFGVMGVIARLVFRLLDDRDWLAESRLWRRALLAAAGVLGVIAIVVAPIRPVRDAAAFPDDRGFVAQSARQLAPNAPAQRLVVVNPPGPELVIPALFMRASRREPIVPTLALLYTREAVVVSRIDDRTLKITPLGPQNFLTWPTLTRGQQIRLSGVTVLILSVTGEGRPAEVAFRFDVPLEHPSLDWRAWNWASWGYVAFRLPAVGETKEVR